MGELLGAWCGECECSVGYVPAEAESKAPSSVDAARAGGVPPAPAAAPDAEDAAAPPEESKAAKAAATAGGNRKAAAKLAAKAATKATIVGTTATGQMVAIVTKTTITGIVEIIGGRIRTRPMTQTRRSRTSSTIEDRHMYTYTTAAQSPRGENVDHTHAFAHVCI